ncbi:MAG: hypothetical protein M1838_005912 [Thelocarpon superellum]|nr:MAG: hypothetical protein M1838_005912 [Thelocarpon superellum]
MAHNGQYYPRPYDQSVAPAPPPRPGRDPLSLPPNRLAAPDPPLRRTSSFDTGDDAAALLRPGVYGGVSYGSEGPESALSDPYRQGASLGSRPEEELFLQDQNPPPPQYGRASSHGHAMSGYQYQYQSPLSPTQTQFTYNPQQFASTQTPYPMPISNPPAPEPRPPAGPQPYNPALYRAQTQSAPRQSSLPYPQNGYNPSVLGAAPTSAAPVAQPYSPSPYAASPTQYGASAASANIRPQYVVAPRLPSGPVSPAPPPLPLPPLPAQAGSAPLPHRPSAYSPPAPPPPPVPPGTAPPSQYASRVLPRPSDLSDPNLRRKSITASPQQAGTPSPSPNAPRPPRHLPHRTDTLGRHPHARPLPGPPNELDDDEDESELPNGDHGEDRTAEEIAQEEIWREIEAAVMTGPTQPQSAHRARQSAGWPQSRADESDEPQPLFSSSRGPSPGSTANGLPYNGAATTAAASYSAGGYSDDSDPEAAAGLAAMRVAEEQEAADDARRQSGGGGPMYGAYGSARRPQPSHPEGESSDSDYANVDMGLYGGGYQGRMSYGDEGSPDRSRHGSARPLPHPGVQPSPQGGVDYEYSIPDQDAIHPFRSFNQAARVDTYGTGGLAEPRPYGRKQSFDEGDETTWGRRSGSESPAKEEIPEMFYFPRQDGGSERPLPPVPASSDDHIPYLVPTGTYRDPTESSNPPTHPAYPPAPDAYTNKFLGLSSLTVPRSTSLTSHSSTPQTMTPARSKTDAEERRAKLLKQPTLGIYPAMPGTEGLDLTSSESMSTLDLPALPAGKRKKFNPAKLSTTDFRRCAEPWALSAITQWVREMGEDETDLKEKILVDGIVALFTHKVPTMNMADAETLGARVVGEMFDSGTVVHDEEWVKFGPGEISGVIWQLTGVGCYAPKLHEHDTPGRCYSHHCSRTLKKINLQTQLLEPQRKLEDWATFYKVTKESVEGVGKKEIERQNILHEIVQTEDQYTDQLNVLRILYRDQLASWQPPIIQRERMARFAHDVFGKVDAVKKVNEDFLLAQLKYRQQEQGPWIVGFSDIFREWIRKARAPYTEYAASFPNATMLVRKEAERNVLFRQFLDQARENERSKRLGWDTYLKAPITRLQRYGLLLYTVHKSMMQDTEEKANLQVAMDEIKAVTLECDARVAEMSKKVDLIELGSKLILRPGMERVELNLNHLGRQLIFQGDLQRTGANRFTWLETHAILFDHYLVLAKTVHQRDNAGGNKQERYDVSKLPIPMDLLLLESTNDDPVVKSSVKGIGTVTTSVTRVPTAGNPQLARVASNIGPGTLTSTPSASSVSSVSTASSGKTLVASTVLEGPKDEKIMYPFRVKHLGQDVYTLYAPTLQNRQDWCDKILEAKTKHAASLFAQNAEPFRLRVMADSAFAYDSTFASPTGATIRGTPLDRALREVDQTFASAGPRPHPICSRTVNCATTFNQPYGRAMVAVGTDYGVYVSDLENPRGWSRAISTTKVTQIAVLEEFSLFLLIADKSLIAYHLDVVCPVGGAPPGNDSARRAPQKLSGAREVGFFATGRMKERTLVFYKKREGLSSTFKMNQVLEPVFQKATEKRSRFSRKGTTEFFREFDEFYMPSDCFGINLFHSSLAVSTVRGFEVLTLDKKQGWAVPDLKEPHVSSIAARLTGQKPLGMFRLNETEFLLCYEECAVYVDKHGDVNRVLIMEFVGKAKSAAMYGPYILLFDSDFVEIRNADNGRLKQVISGRDVRCLDDARSGGSAGNRTIKIALQHPEAERMQLVVELLLNEGRQE